MDVVKRIDHMVTSLSPRLMAETNHLTIRSPNISESISLSDTHTHTLEWLKCENRAEEFGHKGITDTGSFRKLLKKCNYVTNDLQKDEIYSPVMTETQ